MDEWEYTVRDHTTHKDTHSPYTEHFSERELELNQSPIFGRTSRSSEASSIKPCTWVQKAIRVSGFAARMLSEFAEQGTIVSIVPLCKEV